MEIAEVHDATSPMVYKWFDRFDEEEIEGLLERDPTDEEDNTTCWTTGRVAEHLS